MNVRILIFEIIVINHWRVHTTPMTLRRSQGQRSRSTGDDRRNHVNSTR